MGLADHLSAVREDTIIVVDCLTLWLSNAMLENFVEHQPLADLAVWTQERDGLLQWLQQYSGAIIMVSNEVGSGIVPLSALARRFQDEQGWLNQAVAAICEKVTLVVAGIPLAVKSGDRGSITTGG
jgi:adenosylcobinamide kinase/adenosylcobinamide-phosphate guanylyltransferase